MDNIGKNSIEYLKSPIRILSVLYLILSTQIYASGGQGDSF